MTEKNLFSFDKLSQYYPIIKPYTMPSMFVHVPDKILEEMIDVFMKQRIYDPKEYVKVSRELVKRHKKFEQLLQKAIMKNGGLAFIRGDRFSPKDGCYNVFCHDYIESIKLGVYPLPGTMCNVCLVSSPETAVALVLSSERMLIMGESNLIWFRRPLRIKYEFRIFVFYDKPAFVSWYYIDEKPPNILFAERLVTKKYLPVVKRIIKKLNENGHYDNIFTIDMGLSYGQPIVIEMAPNPLTDHVSTLLFTRSELEAYRSTDTIILRTPLAEKKIK